MDAEELKRRVFEELEAHRAEGIDYLYCGHCGGIDNVQEVNLIEAVRHLCEACRKLILEWI